MFNFQTLSKFRIRLLVVVTAAVFLFWLPLQTSIGKNKKNSASAIAPKFALLVGINKYQKDWSELVGTHNDVELMKGLLNDLGFKEIRAKQPLTKAACGAQIAESPLKTLCSEQATRKAILDTFDQHLIENARRYKEKNNITPDKGAAVVFYYSGHGNFVPDDNNDEADRRDETLVPTDADKKGNFQIRDDELNDRIQILSRYTTNITFIIDSCHSGTVTRGAGTKNGGRKIDDGVRGETPALSDGIDTRSFYVTISGSLPNEISREDYFPDPVTKVEKINGALTYHFVHLLRRNPGATYRELMNQVRNAVVNLGRNQTPQAEGDLDRLVFGSTVSKGKIPIFPKCKKVSGELKCSEFVRKKPVNDKNFEVHKISMDVGKIVGARSGGAIVVYSPTARELSGDAEKIGGGTIVSANNFGSEAEIVLTDDRFKTVPENAKIVLVSPSFSDEKRRVAIDFTRSLAARDTNSPDAGLENMNRLAERLKDNSYLEAVRVSDLLKTLDTANAAVSEKGSSENLWDIAVVRATYKDFKFGNSQPNTRGEKTPADGDEVYFLSDRNGMPLYNFWIETVNPNAADEIKTALELHVRIENLRNLGNEASELSKKFKIELVRLKEVRPVSENPPQCSLLPLDKEQTTREQQGIRQLRENDLFYFQITNQSTKDLYLYIYSLGTSGKISLLYPPAGVSEVISRGNSLATHGANQCHIFIIKPGAPFGKETIKFIATAEPFPADLLESPPIGKGIRSGSSPLERLLMQAATNQRGAEVLDFTVASWTALNFDYEIVP